MSMRGKRCTFSLWVLCRFMSAVRWGILSTAGIAAKNVLALHDAVNAEAVAVASRSLERAEEWAKSHGVPRAYGSYEELLNDKDVDAVYIPLPTAMHKEWSIKCALKGKHVLCEKPVACNADEVKEILAACSAAGVQFMDGVMFMHNKRMEVMSKLIHAEQALGKLLRVTSGFSFGSNAEFLASNIRIKKELEPLGSLGDLGWYNIRVTLWAFGYEMPSSVRAAKWTLNSEGVPIEFDATLFWDDGRQWVDIAGEHSRLTYDDFCISKSPEECEFTVLTRNHPSVPDFKRIEGGRSVTKVLHSCQEQLMFENFSAIVLKSKQGGAATSALDDFWPTVSLKTQTVIDACLASMSAEGARVPVPPVA